MFNSVMKKIFLLAATVFVLGAAVFAQTGPVEGTIKVKNADGTTKPVAGARIDIYRMDIKGKWDVTTDKAGHYVRLGMPLQGTYLLVVSGPGLQWTFQNNVRLTQTSVVDVVCNPGDGSTPTLEQVQSLIAQQKSGGGAATGGGTPQVSAADKEKARKEEEEYKKKVAEAESVNASYKASVDHYNAGVGMMQQNNFPGALSEFEAAASNIDAAAMNKYADFKRIKYKSNANIAEGNYQLGVEKFNKKQKDDAKGNFEKAVASAQQAIELASTDTAEPNINNDLLVYYGIYAKNVMLLIEHYGQADKLDTAVANFDKAATLDATNKTKWGVWKADAYRFIGDSEKATAAYKAVLATDPNNINSLYGLGLTLIASQERNIIQEGANALGDFVAKAPPDDRRVPAVKEALEAVKNAYKIEAEKPSKRGTRKPN
ncbi:MAG: carboxypeptidase regulatory-like domain-containing protein [Acidobacteriota bacterium]